MQQNRTLKNIVKNLITNSIYDFVKSRLSTPNGVVSTKITMLKEWNRRVEYRVIVTTTIRGVSKQYIVVGNFHENLLNEISYIQYAHNDKEYIIFEDEFLFFDFSIQVK